MARITNEQIAEARKMDLLTYLQTYEPQELVKHGNHSFRTATHDSLIISNGLWDWKSKGIGGKTALDFLVKVRGVPFIEAVQTLSHERPAPANYRPPPKRPSQPPKPFKLPPPHSSNYTMGKYLESRGISPVITAHCVHSGILYENEKYHSCVFVGKDEKGVPRFGCYRSTDEAAPENRKRGDLSGSDKRYSFVIPPEGKQSAFLSVFEAPIDAMSFATMQHMQKGGAWKDQHYISLSGTASTALTHYLKQHPEIKIVDLRLDNDGPGRAATERITKELEPKGYTVLDNPPVLAKDYNAELQKMIETKERASQEKQRVAVRKASGKKRVPVIAK